MCPKTLGRSLALCGDHTPYDIAPLALVDASEKHLKFGASAYMYIHAIMYIDLRLPDVGGACAVRGARVGEQVVFCFGVLLDSDSMPERYPVFRKFWLWRGAMTGAMSPRGTGPRSQHLRQASLQLAVGIYV